MTAENKDFFEALSMLEHERGITAEYLIEKIKAAIIIAVKKNYEVEEDHIRVDIDPDTGRFDVALIQDIVADEDWYDEHSEIGITEAQKIRNTTDKEVNVLLSEANKNAEILIAEGEAEYMRILSEAYSDESKQDFYSFVRSLDALKASMTGDNKTVILSPDSPIAQIFYGR